VKMMWLFAAVLLTGTCFGQGCKTLVVKNESDKRAKAWNCARVADACTAKPGNKQVQVGRHYVCDEAKAVNPGPLSGYHVVFYTDGCSECAVGWLYEKGERCGPNDLNCMD
jgi:hypothetical protein